MRDPSRETIVPKLIHLATLGAGLSILLVLIGVGEPRTRCESFGPGGGAEIEGTAWNFGVGFLALLAGGLLLLALHTPLQHRPAGMRLVLAAGLVLAAVLLIARAYQDRIMNELTRSCGYQLVVSPGLPWIIYGSIAGIAFALVSVLLRLVHRQKSDQGRPGLW